MSTKSPKRCLAILAKRIKENPSLGQELCIIRTMSENLDEFQGFVIALHKPYAGALIRFYVSIPEDYGMEPPLVFIKAPIYHPFVNRDGRVCLNIFSDHWSPALKGFLPILSSLVCMFAEPILETVGSCNEDFVHINNMAGYCEEVQVRMLGFPDATDVFGFDVVNTLKVNPLQLLEEMINKNLEVVLVPLPNENLLQAFLRPLQLSSCYDKLREFGVDTVRDLFLLENDNDWQHIQLRPLDKIKIRKALERKKQKQQQQQQKQQQQQQQPITQSRLSLFQQENLLPMASPINSINKKPQSSCLGEISTLSNIAGMEKLHLIIEQCSSWCASFHYEPNPLALDEDEIFAIAVYTFDLRHQGTQEENFYFRLNEMLRKRSTQEYDKWRGYLYYIQKALSKFPNISTTLYRGIPFSKFNIIESEYIQNRPIFWSGFTSATQNLPVAKDFSKAGGIIMSIKVYTGKDINKYSCIPGEDEVLMLPNTKYTVTKSVYKNMDDGYFYIDLEEQYQPFIF